MHRELAPKLGPLITLSTQEEAQELCEVCSHLELIHSLLYIGNHVRCTTLAGGTKVHLLVDVCPLHLEPLEESLFRSFHHPEDYLENTGKNDLQGMMTATCPCKFPPESFFNFFNQFTLGSTGETSGGDNHRKHQALNMRTK